jgi:hypothetical protein
LTIDNGITRPGGKRSLKASLNSADRTLDGPLRSDMKPGGAFL